MSRILDVDFANTFHTQEREEESRLRNLLQSSPADFDLWLELVKQIEKYVISIQKSGEKSKAIYQDFLQEFPQYYPVWRKLAEVYNSEDNQEMVICSFEEGLKYLPSSTDLWLHYSIWKCEHSSIEDSRALFIRALDACGKVYTSNLLWDKYLDFEKSHKNFEAIERIFNHLLTFPTNKLYEYYTRFKNFIDSQYKDLPEDARKRKKDEIVSSYEKVVSENNKRKNFEQAIKRSAFSTKPLDAEQLQNWRKYLDYEEKEGCEEKIVLLFERCVVPCCYYFEFWVRYARYIERTKGEEAARAVYVRANRSFLKRKPELFVAQGYFEESHKNLEEARRLYKHAYEDVAPGLINGILKHANLERRVKCFDEAEKLYEMATNVCLSSGRSGNIAFITSEFAKYWQLVKGNLEKAIEVYELGLSRAGENKALYFAYINALNCLKSSEEKLLKIKAAYEMGLMGDSKLPISDQLELWVSYIDFMRNSWKDFEDVKEAETLFRKNFHHHNVLTSDFKARCKIKRMKISDTQNYPEPIKRNI